MPVTLPGTYKVIVRAAGQQAGAEAARMAVTVNGKPCGTVEVTATTAAPAEYVLLAGELTATAVVSVEFINDLYDPAGQGDRNLVVDWMELDGPHGLPPGQNPRRATILVCDRKVAGADACARTLLQRFARRAWRRPPVKAEVDRRGILGHGSVLTATSQANRTSAVKRGKGVLGQLLCGTDAGATVQEREKRRAEQLSVLDFVKEDAKLLARRLGIASGHHDLSHHGGDTKKMAELQKIGTWEVQPFAEFLGKLRAVPEGEGSLLDQCVAVFSSEISDGDAHGHQDLPVIVAGRGGGFLQPGRHVVHEATTPALYFDTFEHADIFADAVPAPPVVAAGARRDLEGRAGHRGQIVVAVSAATALATRSPRRPHPCAASPIASSIPPPPPPVARPEAACPGRRRAGSSRSGSQNR